MRRPPRATIALALTLPTLLALGACGSDDDSSESSTAAPEASAFPSVTDGGLDQLAADAPQDDNLVVLPAGSTFTEGRNRFGFGVFDVDGAQVTDAEVAIYAAPGPDGQVEGPFPARVDSLETDPGFVAQTTSGDPDAAKAVYVTDLVLDRPGEWRLVAVEKQEDGSLRSSALPSVEVQSRDPVPEVGEQTPKVHTPTVDDVGDIQEIETRVPPDSMHDVDFADVVGKQPVVLLFATPALCTSRVCGPVVDVAEQVKRDLGDEAAFIHMEIYEDNNANKGPRPQVQAFNLPSEPWLFVLDCAGKVTTRIEGAFSATELEDAVDRATAKSC